MSLIADALKAAQEEKSKQGAPERAAARRFLSSSVTVGGRRGEAVKWEAPAAESVPRPLRIAVGVFAVATLAAIGFVVLSPGEDSPSDSALAAETATTAAPPAAAEDGSAERAGDAEGAGGAGAGEDPAPAEAEALAAAEYDEPPAEEIETAAAPESRAPARRVTMPVAAPSYQEEAPVRREEAAAPAPAASERAGEPGRFQLRLEPSRAPGVSSSFEQALSAQRRRDFPAAIELYQRAIAAEPTNAEALNNLGATYQASGDLPRARDAFRRSLAVNPAFAAAWNNLAVVLGALGETSEAQAALAEAIRLDPSNHGAKVNLALQYQRQGLVPEARRLLDQVVQTAPQMAEAHYALGRLLEEQGDRAAAIRHYKLFLSTGSGRFAQLDPLVRQRVIQLGGNPDAR